MRRGQPFGWFRRATQVLLGLAPASSATSTLATSSFAGSSGTWTFTARDADGNTLSGVPVVFSVDAEALISASLSTVDAAPGTIDNDGVGTSTITNSLVDTDGDPVVGFAAASTVNAATGTGNTLTQPASATNVLGQNTATLVSTVAATKVASLTAGSLAITDTASIVVSGTGEGGTTVFYDDFASGDLTHTENNAAWTDSANASVQTGAAIPAGLDTYALRLYDATGSPVWFEQRFEFLDGLAEPYFEWYQYFPDGTESPSLGPVYADQGSANNKFFRVWGASYSAVPELGASTWSDDINVEFMENIGGSIQGMGEGVSSSPYYPREANFFAAGIRGSWVRIRVRAKMATSANNDGIFQLWVGETLWINHTNIPNYGEAASPTFYNGYLMGYANTGFASGQRTFIGRFRISSGGFV